jgi:regulator of replication initiation timing
MFNKNRLTAFEKEILKIVKLAGKSITAEKILEKLNWVHLSTGEKIGDGQIREVINILRDKGFPVCANSFGYYEPCDKKDLSDYISRFEARICEQQKAVDNLKQSLIDWERNDQLLLF